MGHFTVDRIEGRIVILIGDDGSEYPVSRRVLPKGAHEGCVLAVETSVGNGPDWARATLDPLEQRRRLERSRELLDELKRRDPGGDITI